MTNKSTSLEQCLIGSILKNPSVYDDISEIIDIQDFLSPRHAGIYRVISELAMAGKPIEVLSVAEVRPDDFDYLTDLAVETLDVGPVFCAERIAKDAAKRESLSKLNQALEVIQSGRDYYEDINAAQQILNTLEREKESTVKFKDALKESIDMLEKRFQGIAPKGINTGFRDIDARFMGLQPANLWILAARPSMGKSTLLMNIMCNMAMNGLESVFFSLEMSRQQVVDRILSSVSSIPLNRIKTGQLLDADWTALQAGVSKLIDKHIHIIDRPAMNINHIAAISRKFARRAKLGCIGVDYLQLCRADTKSRFDEISEVSRALKSIAKTTETPVIALSQLSRQVENRPNKRPINSDLRESGQIEQDADIITFMYRDEVYNKDTTNKGICEVITSKFRDGETGTDLLKSELDRIRFVDLAKNFVPPPIQESGGFYNE